MHGPFENRGIDCRDQVARALGEVLAETGRKSFSASDERTIVFIAEKVVEDALAANAGGGPGDVEVGNRQNRCRDRKLGLRRRGWFR